MKIAILAIAAALIGAGNGLTAFANGEVPETPASGGDDGEGSIPGKRRGRPAGSTNKPAEPEKQPETPADDPEKRLAHNREITGQLIKDGNGQLVKNVLKKYTDGTLKDLPAEHQAAFEKDIEALSI